MADESAICAEFLYGKLNTSSVTTALGSASRIYDTDVPQEAAGTVSPTRFPCVVFQQQASIDTFTSGNMGARIFARPLWVVKVIVDNQSFKSAAAIYDEVDAVLQGQSGTATDGSVYACYRESSNIRYSEPKMGGGYFRHRGGEYRLEVRATTTP